MADPEKAKQEHAQLQQELIQLQQSLRQALNDLLARCTFPTTARSEAIRARLDALLDGLQAAVRDSGVTQWQDKLKTVVEELEFSRQSADSNAKASEAKEKNLETMIRSFDANAAQSADDRKAIEQLQSTVQTAQADQQQAVTQATQPLQRTIGKQEQVIEELKKRINELDSALKSCQAHQDKSDEEASRRVREVEAAKDQEIEALRHELAEKGVVTVEESNRRVEQARQQERSSLQTDHQGPHPDIMAELAKLPALIKQALRTGDDRVASSRSITSMGNGIRIMLDLLRRIPGISYAEMFLRLAEIERNVDESEPSDAERNAVLAITSDIRRVVRRAWGTESQVDLSSAVTRLNDLDAAVEGVQFKNKSELSSAVSLARHSLDELSWVPPAGVISGCDVAYGVQQLQSDFGRMLQSLRHVPTVDETLALAELERLAGMITEATNMEEINNAAETLRNSFIGFFSAGTKFERALIIQQYQALELALTTAGFSPDDALAATTSLLLNLHAMTLDPSTIASDLALYLAPADSRPGTAASGSQSEGSRSRQPLDRPETAQGQIIPFGKHSQHETPSTSHRARKSAREDGEVAGSVFGVPIPLRTDKGKQRAIEPELEPEESMEQLHSEDAPEVQQITRDEAFAKPLNEKLNEPAVRALASSSSEVQPPDPTEGMTEAEAAAYRADQLGRQNGIAGEFFSARQKGDKNRASASRACDNHSSKPLTASQATKNNLSAMRDQLVDDVDATKKRKERLNKEPKIASMLYRLFESRGQAGSSDAAPTLPEQSADDPYILDQELASEDDRLESYGETISRLNAVLEQMEKDTVEDDSSVLLRAKTELARRQKARETEQQAAATQLTQQSTYAEGVAFQDLLGLLEQAIKDAETKKELLGNDRRLALALAIQQDQPDQDVSMPNTDEAQEARAIEQQQQIEDSLVQACQTLSNTADKMLRQLKKRMNLRFDALKPHLTQAFADREASEKSAKDMPKVITSTADRARLQEIIDEQQKLADAAAERSQRLQRDGMFARALADKNQGTNAKGDKVSDETMHKLIEQEKKMQEDCLQLVHDARQKLPGQMPPPSGPLAPAPRTPSYMGSTHASIGRSASRLGDGPAPALSHRPSRPNLGGTGDQGTMDSRTLRPRASQSNLPGGIASPTPGPRRQMGHLIDSAAYIAWVDGLNPGQEPKAHIQKTAKFYENIRGMFRLPSGWGPDQIQSFERQLRSLFEGKRQVIDVVRQLDEAAFGPLQASTRINPNQCLFPKLRKKANIQISSNRREDCAYHNQKPEDGSNKYDEVCVHARFEDGVQAPFTLTPPQMEDFAPDQARTNGIRWVIGEREPAWEPEPLLEEEDGGEGGSEERGSSRGRSSRKGGSREKGAKK